MEKEKSNTIYKIIIVILVLALGCTIYFGFIRYDIKTDNQANEKTNIEDTSNQNNEEKINPNQNVEEVKGFAVKKANVTLNGKNNEVEVSYNKVDKIDKEGYNIETMEYQIYLNNIKVVDATNYYILDSDNDMGDYVENFNNNNLKVVKGEDKKDYLVIDFHNPNLFAGDGEKNIYVVSENAKLLSSLIINDDTQIGKLTGDGSNKYYEDKNYYKKYSIASDKLYYIVAPESNKERSECDFTEFYLTFNNEKAESHKTSIVFHGSEFSGAAGLFDFKLTIK